MTVLRYARRVTPAGLDALSQVADAGYGGIALCLDDADVAADELRRRLDALCLEVVVDTGPPLPDPARRLAHLRRAGDLAEVLRAEAVTLRAPGRHEAGGALVDELCALSETHGHAAYCLAVQPEPGTLVGNVADWDLLRARVPGLWLALETDLDGQQPVREYARHLGAVTVGECDLQGVVGALMTQGYDRLVTVSGPLDVLEAAETAATA